MTATRKKRVAYLFVEPEWTGPGYSLKNAGRAFAVRSRHLPEIAAMYRGYPVVRVTYYWPPAKKRRKP